MNLEELNKQAEELKQVDISTLSNEQLSQFIDKIDSLFSQTETAISKQIQELQNQNQ